MFICRRVGDLFAFKIIIRIMTSTCRPVEKPPQSQPRQDIINPFERDWHQVSCQFAIETFIKKEVEAIFLSKKKIDMQARLEIYWKTSDHQVFELTSCSIVYSMIRESVEHIAKKLRKMIDYCYVRLESTYRNLCRLSDVSASWKKNWLRFRQDGEPESMQHIYPPVSNAYIWFYKHLCDSAKELNNLWNIIYQHIPIKDLKCESFYPSLSQHILDIFTAPTQQFKPHCMLPIMSLANKCRFINADAQYNSKKLDLTRFAQDELAQNLLTSNASKLKLLGMHPEDSLHRYSHESVHTYSSKRLDRYKLDSRFLAEIRRQYVDSELQDLPPVKNIAFLGNETGKVRTELANAFEVNTELIYELEDTSSQEDDLHTYYVACNSSNNDELIEDNQTIELQQFPSRELLTKENQTFAKLSSSTGIEENNDNQDLIMKNFDFQFSLPSDLSPDPFETAEREDAINFQLSRLEQKYSKKPCSKDHNFCCHLQKYKKKIAKLHDKQHKEHKEPTSRPCHYPKKQWLERYTQQQKQEMQEMLRQVQKLQKQKDKDKAFYKLINEISSQPGGRNHKYICPCCQCKHHGNNNQFRSSRREIQFSQDVGSSLMSKTELIQKIKNKKIAQICPQKQANNNKKVEPSQEPIEKITNANDTKMSKRQQKLQKKIERQMRELKSANVSSQSQQLKETKEVRAQDQLQLTNFLEQLNLSKGNRADCRVEEAIIDKWKSKVYSIRNAVVKTCQLAQSNIAPQQATGKARKKKKNRH